MSPDQVLNDALASLEVGKSRLPLLALVTATLSEGRCNGSVAGSQTMLNASYVTALVGVRVGKSPLQTSIASLSSGQLVAHNSSLVAQKSYAGLSVLPSMSEMQINLPDWSPSVIVQLSDSIFRAIRPLMIRVKEHQVLTARRRCQLFHDLLNACCHAPPTADPLSRTQVSFMVNSGTPQALRADPSLSVITSLRAAVRNAKPGVHGPSVFVDAGWEEMMETQISASLVHLSERAAIDLHPDDVPESFVYRQLFTSDENSASSFALFPLLLHLSSRRVVVNLGTNAEAHNQLELGPGYLRFQVAERAFLKSQSLSANKSSTSLLPAQEQPMFQVIIAGSLAVFRITLHPSLLSVIEGVLRFKRKYPQNRVQRLAKGRRKAQKKEPNSTLFMVETFVDIEQFEVRALAQVLSVGMRLKGGHLSSSLVFGHGVAFPSSRSSKLISVSVLTGCREFSVQARSTQDESDSDHPDRAVLAALTLLDGGLFAATDLEDFRGTITLNSMKFAVPRSAMKLYTFVKQWEAEYLP